MNSYLYQYVVKRLDENLFSKIKEILSNHTGYEESKVENFNGNTFDPNNQDLTRKSKVCFVDNHDLYDIIWEQVDEVNSNSMWNFDVDYIEPLQNTLYNTGDYYEWHVDETNWTPKKRNDGRIRKISFTLCLDDNHEGGELEFILNRKITIPLKKGEIVFFHSEVPHQVDKVTKGTRKSLVGWIQGPAFR